MAKSIEADSLVMRDMQPHELCMQDSGQSTSTAGLGNAVWAPHDEA